MTPNQNAVKEVSSAYIPFTILSNNHNSKVLLNAISSYNSPSCPGPVDDNNWTEKFAAPFIQMLESICSNK